MISFAVYSLIPLAVVIVAAATLCASLIIILLPLLRHYALARPNARSSHSEPTPQGAGLAVVAASLSVASVALSWSGMAVPFTVFAAALFIALLGFCDDIKPIPVLPRLLLQATAVGAIIFWEPASLRIFPACPLVIERGLLWFLGLWFVNLVNFMDGLDLMTVAEVVPVTGAMAVLGLIGVYPQTPTLLAAALFGAMLGFAPFNRPVARVFLGDVGSLPIGLLLGWCLLQLAWHQQLLVALLLPLYYLSDASITLFLRISKGEPFWAAHRSHFYQRATDNGWSVSRVVAEVFVLNIILAALAILSTRANSTLVNLLVGAAGVTAVAQLLFRFSRKRMP